MLSIHRNSARFITTLSALAALSCSTRADAPSADTSAELEGVPELGAVEMALTYDPENEGTAVESDAVDPESESANSFAELQVPEDAATGDGVAEDLSHVRVSIKRLNQVLREFLKPIAQAIRETDPSHTLGETRVWGPVVQKDTEYRFLLRHARDARYSWRLDARVADDAGLFTRIAAGTLVAGDVPRRGSGAMGVDLDALASVNPNVSARGQLLIGFHHGAAGATVGYGLHHFTPDMSQHAEVDALLRGVHLENGFNRLRLAYQGDVEGTASSAEELVLTRVRHQRDLGGRSDLVALGGDVNSESSLLVSQCWDAQLTSVFRQVRECPLGELPELSQCTTKSEQGSADACATGLLEAEWPPTDPNAAMPDEEDPYADVSVPATLDELEDAELD